ncbi:HD domain-containing protein [Shewanella xiamenensis]|uniref:HD domain-containing phosphohydrolase n=1 Tax=Shewanella xiamenensis TaxID=332186 RepID=UPI00215002BD|nr:HD domain-containing phosphohydrolase [Shewanella xiamenensis]MCR4534357.1 HD domain-containing protein [Shewanella xiamenensis]WHF54420.1 HD domain-containing protein [Shewanella xiamenensis]
MSTNHGLIVGTMDLPDGLHLSWAQLDKEFRVQKMSQAFYERCNRSAAQIINKPICQLFSAFDTDLCADIEHRSDGYIGFQLQDNNGTNVHFALHAVPEDGWYLILSEINFEDPKIKELHVDYRRAIQASDVWLQHIEEVIRSSPEDVFRVAVAKSVALSSSRHGFILLYNEKSKLLTLAARTQYPQSKIGLQDIVEEETQAPETESLVWLECAQNFKPIIKNSLGKPADTERVFDKLLLDERYLAVPILFRNRLMGIICVVGRSDPYSRQDARSLLTFASILWHSIELPRSLRAVSRQSKIIKAQKEQLSQSLTQLISAISEALELKDAYTAGHQKSVAQLSYLIGEKLGLEPQRLEGLKIGALVHDIGKLAIPSQILTKPSKLSKEEYALIQTHPQHGAEIVEDVEFPWPIKQMILQHHERLDGSGYPLGLKDKAILYEAKIIAVADVADSILSHRPYRPSLGLAKMTEVLRAGKGTLFDPDIVETCLEVLINREISISDHIGSAALDPVVTVTLDHELADIKRLLAHAHAKVAVVQDEEHHLIGVITQRLLDYWLSPLIGSAAEREQDRAFLRKKAHQIMEHSVPLISDVATSEDALQQLNESDSEFLVVVNKAQHAIGVIGWRAIAMANKLRQDVERLI